MRQTGKSHRQPAPSYRCLGISALLAMSWISGSTIRAQAQDNWPQLSFDNAHLGFNPSETTLSVSNVSHLRQLWTFSARGSLSSPAVVAGVLYVGSGDGHAYAVNANTGTLVWKTVLAGGGTSASPAVINGMVYLGTGVDSGEFYALNAANGKIVWSFRPAGGVQSSAAVGSGIVYFGDTAGNVYALNATTGAILWTFLSLDNPIFSSPSVADGIVYIGENDGEFVTLNETTGTVLWDDQLTGFDPIYAPAAVANGVVYAAGEGFNVYVFDAATGQLLNTLTTGGPTYFSSPVVVNGRVFVGSFDRKIHAWGL
jgi:outer membrane protein assembly factor BamB